LNDPRSLTIGVEPVDHVRLGFPPLLPLDAGDRPVSDFMIETVVHRDEPLGPMRDPDLLFPSQTGGFRAASAPDNPLRLVGEAVKLKKRVTSRAMRRTFQDLGRKPSSVRRSKAGKHRHRRRGSASANTPRRFSNER
jgi:hypothetical protein